MLISPRTCTPLVLLASLAGKLYDPHMTPPLKRSYPHHGKFVTVFTRSAHHRHLVGPRFSPLLRGSGHFATANKDSILGKSPQFDSQLQELVPCGISAWVPPRYRLFVHDVLLGLGRSIPPHSGQIQPVMAHHPLRGPFPISSKSAV